MHLCKCTSAGHQALATKKDQEVCPKGQYNDKNCTQCAQCANGKFANITGSHGCTAASIGHYAKQAGKPLKGAAKEVPCAPGTTSSSKGASSCRCVHTNTRQGRAGHWMVRARGDSTRPTQFTRKPHTAAL